MKKVFKLYIYFIGLGLILGGCASSDAPKAGDAYLDEIMSFTPADDEAGIVLFYEDQADGMCKIAACAGVTKISINGEEVSELEVGDAAFVRIVPGEHRLLYMPPLGEVGCAPAICANPKPVHVNIKGGEIYYLVGVYDRISRPGRNEEVIDVKHLSTTEGRKRIQNSVLRLSRQFKIQSTMSEE